MEIAPVEAQPIYTKNAICKSQNGVGVIDADNANTHTETAEKVLAVLKTILLNKLPGAHDKWDQGAPAFIATIHKFVEKGEAVQMCLPAFPWKSANKVEKVLGILPDKAEEVALARLNGICETIGTFYAPGAEILIISDGLVYNGKYLYSLPLLMAHFYLSLSLSLAMLHC
jgi:hypothetical protein